MAVWLKSNKTFMLLSTCPLGALLFFLPCFFLPPCCHNLMHSWSHFLVISGLHKATLIQSHMFFSLDICDVMFQLLWVLCEAYSCVPRVWLMLWLVGFFFFWWTVLSCLVLDGKFGRSSDIFFKLSIVFLFYFQSEGIFVVVWALAP